MQIFYTPLEQFDEVTWLTHRVIETLRPYRLFITEIEFETNQLYSNSFEETFSFRSLRQSKNELVFLIIVISLFFHYIPVMAIQLFSLGGEFSHLFFLLIINLATGVFFVVWFTDFFFVTELINPAGNLVRFNYIFAPQIDFSFALDEIIITFLLGFFLIGGAKNRDDADFILETEADFSLIEEVVAPLFVANLGKNIAENGALYLKVCSIFSFVLISNLLGRIPYGDTATSSLVLTFWVAFSVFASLVTLIIRKHGFNYFFSLFRPSGCPFPLIFLLIPIEFLSYSFRLVSLSVRLFANRMAGHTLIKVLIGFSYVIFTLGDGYAVAAFLPALVVFVLIFLEMAVACIQAYIFTILTCIYLKDLYVSHLYLFMPQLDIDLLEDFMFFAFIAFLLGFGDEESEENVIERSSEAYLAQYYLSTRKALSAEIALVAQTPARRFHLLHFF